MLEFIQVFKHYLYEILPALAIGFLISGIIHELVPGDLVKRHLSDKGLSPIFYATFVGALLPVCCWGSLPIALSFYKKGAKLGPVLAFLVATPATSVSALLVTYKLLGLKFTVFIFFAVILMGMVMGIIGNFLKFTPRKAAKDICPHCEEEVQECHDCGKKKLSERVKSIFKYAFIAMPKEIGIELTVGIILAATVATVLPIGLWIKHNLGGGLGYLFSVVFGLIMYICSTSTVPLVDALIQKGLSVGAGMTLLLIGPITSYGTILVFKKEFGMRILLVYLAVITVLSVGLGYLFSII